MIENGKCTTTPTITVTAATAPTTFPYYAPAITFAMNIMECCFLLQQQFIRFFSVYFILSYLVLSRSGLSYPRILSYLIPSVSVLLYLSLSYPSLSHPDTVLQRLLAIYLLVIQQMLSASICLILF